jgi:hypothetical protein
VREVERNLAVRKLTFSERCVFYMPCVPEKIDTHIFPNRTAPRNHPRTRRHGPVRQRRSPAQLCGSDRRVSWLRMDAEAARSKMCVRRWRALGKRSSDGRTGAGCGPVRWGVFDGLYARLTTREGIVGFGVNEDLRRMVLYRHGV